MSGCDDWGDETNPVGGTNRDYWETNLIARGATWPSSKPVGGTTHEPND